MELCLCSRFLGTLLAEPNPIKRTHAYIAAPDLRRFRCIQFSGLRPVSCKIVRGLRIARDVYIRVLVELCLGSRVF